MKGDRTMFETERFIESCKAAIKERDAQAAIRELVAEAVSDPAQIVRALGEPQRAGIGKIYQGSDLTIVNLCWGPQMTFKPHDHQMWAVIGIYGGQERNIFFRRNEMGLTQHGTKELHAKETIPLGASIIHSVTNPLDQLTAAIHIYGGDFFAQPRSEWDPVTFKEQPYDVQDTMRRFEQSNERLNAK
jgi:predicted metal-dependent enzyme (double-stranded beta helix superfamily)